MPYAWQYVKPGEGSNVPNWGDPLWRRCLFASSVGTVRGQRQGTLNGSEAHGRFRSQRSVIPTAGGFTPNGVCWQRWAGGGRGFDNGDGVTSINPEAWDSINPNNYYAVSGAGFTGAVIIRPDAFSTNGQIPFFKHRAQPYGAANPGWSFTGAAGNLWRFNYSDGVTQRTVTGGAQDPNFTRPDLVIARLNTANTLLEFFTTVGGGGTLQLVGSSSFAATAIGVPAATEDVKILGYGPLNEVYPGFITFAAFWDRPLANGELMRLAADPFVMWRFRMATEIGREEIGLVSEVHPVAADMNRGPILAIGIDAPGAPGQDLGCCHCCAPAASLLF